MGLLELGKIAMKTLGMLLVLAAVALGACEKSTPEPAPVAQQSAPMVKNAGEAYASIYNSLSKAATSVDLTQGGQDAVLQEHASQIEQLIEQSKSSDADFGVKYDEGFLAEMPHLGQTRAFWRLLDADAKRAIAAGDSDGACKRIAAILRLATQIAMPAQTEIELLIASAMSKMTSTIVIENPSLAKAAWKTDVQNALVGATDTIVTRSFGPVEKEFDMTIRDLRANKIPDLSSKEFGEMGKNWPAATAAEREDAAKNLEALKSEIKQVWNAPDAIEKIKSATKAREGKAGSDLVANLWKVKKAVNEAKEEMAKAASVLNK